MLSDEDHKKLSTIKGLNSRDLESGKYQKKGIIAMIDALGASSWNTFKKNEEFILNCFLHKNTAENLYAKTQSAIRGHVGKLPEPNMIIFQDTLLFEWEVPEDKAELIEIAAFYLSGMLAMSYTSNFIFRGAISYGDYIKHDNFILGTAVNDAHISAESSHWSGIFISKNARKLISDNSFSLVNYDVPQQKTKRVKHPLGIFPCCRWPREFCNTVDVIKADPLNKSLAKKVFNEHISAIEKNNPSNDLSVKEKYQNTQKYFNWFVNTQDLTL